MWLMKGLAPDPNNTPFLSFPMVVPNLIFFSYAGKSLIFNRQYTRLKINRGF